jgi:hypothetical protein
MLIRRGLEIGRDPPVAENVEQVLAHAGVDVADHGVFGREQPVVPPSVACAPAGHVSSSRPVEPTAARGPRSVRRADSARVFHREKRSPHES